MAVAETGNISRAAQKLFLTQPALSRQVKALEDEIGQPLLERQAHSIRLMPAGEALLREARDLLERADQALERVRASGRAVRLRVGYAPSLAGGLLSIAVERFRQRHPTAHVELFDLSTNEMLAGLRDETLDVAITVAQDRAGYGLSWTPLIQVSWQVAVSHSHRLAQRSRITPADMAQEPLLVFCQRDYPEYWDLVTGWLREHGQQPTITGEYDGVNSLLAAVESGMGIALVTTSTARLTSKRVRLKSLSNAPRPQRIAVGHRKDHAVDKPLAVFIKELCHAAQTLQE